MIVVSGSSTALGRELSPAPSPATDGHCDTRVAASLRRHRLGDPTHIKNFLCGHMSLVGPRPERPEFAAGLRKLPDYDLHHLIRPGLTGIAELTAHLRPPVSRIAPSCRGEA
jgi:lipopolysaccharide/colanic/teichoic acid biosynthesis glycosyltransferase